MREFAIDTPFGRISGLRRDVAGGPRVLALHGWLDNAASFVPLAPHLPGLELAAPDLPGHGASAHLPAAADYTMVAFARAGFAIADALGWERFGLLAHSLGGAVASVMAAACPQRIERLLVIESLGALAEADDRTAQRLREAFAAGALPRRPLRVFDDIATAVRARMQANALSEAVARLLVERGIAPAAADAAGFVWRSDPRLTQPTAVRISEAQVRDLVAGIACPTRVIYATPAQPYFPEAIRRARAALLPDGELVVMDGSHHLHMEDPAGVAAAIGDFFDRP
ncbi:alpha/beta fold hydrolase [Lysobacter sp. D1-1-M9]|uniref:alpha/beta fold hydrolase n=1 Tax=Novilysobacter longmucuonensis TaxID=3098603 RepID=UPI002FCB088E